MKKSEQLGGTEAFDQIQAEALSRLKDLSRRNDLPQAFVLAIPSLGSQGEAAVELITCVPTDPTTETQFLGMTMQCLVDWGRDIKEMAEARLKES